MVRSGMICSGLGTYFGDHNIGALRWRSRRLASVDKLISAMMKRLKLSSTEIAPVIDGDRE